MIPTAFFWPTYPTIPPTSSAALAVDRRWSFGLLRRAAGRPAVLHHLRRALHGERARRHVPGDHGAGRHVRALADGDGRHEARVGPHERPVADRRLVLALSVVVAGDGAGAH